jgi:hypothetical protein
MIYLALGCLLLAGFVWMGRGGRILKRREWRITSAGFAVAAFAGAAFVGLRGEWPVTIVLLVVGLWLAASARRTHPASSAAAPRSRDLGDAEARSILGVGPNASKTEIQLAYARLIQVAHPDKGGTDGLAAQLNAARDRLLRK